ncbi:MAG: triple tyrosine motif-containing protein [Bacteroidota bacterium]
MRVYGSELPRLRHFNLRNYGGQNQSWDFTQVEDGQIFVANSGGIFQYDGSRWIDRQLPGQPVVRTVLYHEGRLFAGGFGEFGYWDLDAQEDTYISLSDQLNNNGSFTEEIWHIVSLADGSIVFQSFTQLFLFDGEEVKPIKSPGLLMFSYPAGNKLYVPNTGQGIGIWEPNQTFSLITSTQHILQDEVTGIAEEGEKMLFATSFEGIYQLEDNELYPYPIPAEVAAAQINRILKLSDGRLAIGTILDGLFILSPGSRRIECHLNRQNGLQNNTVLALFEDEAKDLWVGLDRGIDLVVRSESAQYFTAQQQAVGAVYTAIEHEGNFYLGTNQGLYTKSLSDPKSKFQLIPSTAGQVWDLHIAEGSLLCGHNEGTYEISGNTARLISEYSGGWQTMSCPFADGVYIQNTYTGLIWMEKKEGNWTSERIMEFIVPIKYGSWISPWKLLALHGSRGAFILDIDSEEKRIKSIDTLDQSEIIQGQVVNLDSNILIQNSQGKVFQLNGLANTLDPIDQHLGADLSSGAFILPGREQTSEWFLVTLDLVRMYKDDLLVCSLPIRIRIPQPTIMPWNESDYLICLDDGYAITSLDQSLESLPALNLDLFLKTAGGKWSPVAEREEVSIPYAKNQIRFQYYQALFDRQTEFQYRLMGLNDTWSDWSENSIREYASLPDGNYTFEIRSKWSNQIISMAFSILPPWWRTSWAFMAYLILMLVAGRLLFHWHVKRLDRQARALEIKRERELQRQRILARNDQLRLENKRKSKELANSTLALARRNEHLLQLMDQIEKSYKTAKSEAEKARLHKIRRVVEKELQSEDSWAIFESHFEEVHEAFLTRLRQTHPKLSSGDLKLAAYLRMNLSSKEIAPLLHISIRGIENKRYRLRTKLGLDSRTNLNAYLAKF